MNQASPATFGIAGPGTERPPVLVIGAGPGVGAEIARLAIRRGHRVGLVARNEGRLTALIRELESRGGVAALAVADITDPGRLVTALQTLVQALGPPGGVFFCPLPDISLIKPVLDTTAEELMAALDLVVAGAATTIQTVLPGMLARGSGELLFTTGSAGLHPSPDRASSAVSTLAATAYLALLREAVGPRGIAVHHVVISGGIGPGRKHQAATIAEQVWQRYGRPEGNGPTVIDKVAEHGPVPWSFPCRAGRASDGQREARSAPRAGQRNIDERSGLR